MPSSLATAAGLAGLFRDIQTRGPVEALRPFNLQALAGAPAVEVFVALTDMMCPPGGTIDEAIARDAMLETIAAMAAQGVGNFDDLTGADLLEFFIGTVTRSIEGKIFNEIGTNSIALPADTGAVEHAQGMLHDFVDGCVRDRFNAAGVNLTTLSDQLLNGFVSDLYAAAFDLLRAVGERP